MVDGHVQFGEPFTFISPLAWNQWGQWEFECQITLTKVYITNNRYNGALSGNVWISVKNESVVGVTYGSTIGDEDVCGTLPNNFADTSVHELECNQPMVGQFVIFQQRKYEYIRMNEILFFDSYHELGELSVKSNSFSR